VSPIEAIASLALAPGAPTNERAAMGSEDSTAWRIHITAARGAIRDPGNFAGVSRLAADGADRFDRSDPPLAPGPSISLYFLSEDPEAPPRTVDIRSAIPAEGDPMARGRRWVFDVASAGSDAGPLETRIAFDGLSAVPADLEVRLIDRVSMRIIDPRRQKEYLYATSRGAFVRDPAEARFELRVGTLAYVEESRIAARVHETRLLPVYPNPVATTGLLRFEIARGGRVALGVFDISGRRVRTLVQGDLDAGDHEILWRGDDDRGRALASGVYIVRLTAPDRTLTRKVIKTR
jgi:hypothetical protein